MKKQQVSYSVNKRTQDVKTLEARAQANAPFIYFVFQSALWDR